MTPGGLGPAPRPNARAPRAPRAGAIRPLPIDRYHPMTTETVRKTHQLYDEREQVWFDVYEAPGIEGRPITAEVPREQQNPNAVRGHLLSKGAEAAAVENTEALASTIAAEG